VYTPLGLIVMRFFLRDTEPFSTKGSNQFTFHSTKVNLHSANQRDRFA
jgi:hypothetical protein